MVQMIENRVYERIMADFNTFACSTVQLHMIRDNTYNIISDTIKLYECMLDFRGATPISYSYSVHSLTLHRVQYIQKTRGWLSENGQGITKSLGSHQAPRNKPYLFAIVANRY